MPKKTLRCSESSVILLYYCRGLNLCMLMSYNSANNGTRDLLMCLMFITYSLLSTML